MIRVGLTGTLGAGKSTVGRWLERRGAVRVDADELAREAVRPGTEAHARVREAFGPEVVAADGALDRAALRRVAFADPEARERLEAIVHPAVGRLRQVRLEAARRAGARVVVEEVPLLFEVGLEEEFDLVVAVDAPPGLRRERVTEARGVSAETFEAMDAAQMAPEEKRRRADRVVWNDGSLEALEAEARRLWREIDRLADEETGAAGGAPGPGTRAAGADGPPPPTGAPERWAVDLHLHTRHSYDCLVDPARLLAAARERGLDRIAVTDHDRIEGAFEARAVDPERVIVGEEVRTAEGLDLIGLFLSEWIPPGIPFREVARRIRDQGGVVYLPHPFDRWRGAEASFLDEVAGCVDVVEGFNARVHDPARNERARAWAARHGLPAAAGSDAHLLREVGRGRARMPPFTDAASFVEAAARAEIDGRPSGYGVHLGSTWAKLRKRLPF